MDNVGDYASLWAWEPLDPHDLAGLLAGLDCPWWICGGWALDLFLGRETRRHDDLDVAVLRHDQVALYEQLGDWELRYATVDHRLNEWDGRWLDPPIHGIWARRAPGRESPWTCEFLLNEAQNGQWLFRRNPAVTRALAEIGAEVDGVPFLRPEIVLLYKAGEPSPKNDTDFAAAHKLLSENARNWLRRSLELCDPSHPWLVKRPK
jgi:hypothetical protein